MVGPIFVCVDSSMGSSNVPSKEPSEKDTAVHIYGGICGPWLFVWNLICPGAGAAIRNELERDSRMDHCGSAMGLHSRD